MELAAPEVTRENLDGAKLLENRTSKFPGAPRSPLDRETALHERPLLARPEQPAPVEKMLDQQYLCRSGSGPKEETFVKTSDPAVPKAFKCRDCGLAVPSLSDLIHHQSSHGCDRPYSCPECDKSFRRGSDLVDRKSVV